MHGPTINGTVMHPNLMNHIYECIYTDIYIYVKSCTVTHIHGNEGKMELVRSERRAKGA